MKIRILSPKRTPITILDEFLDLQYEKNLSDIGQAKFSVSYTNPKITKESLALFNIIQILYTDDQNVLWTVWEGMIAEFEASPAGIRISCVDWIGVMQWRRLRVSKNYPGTNIGSAVIDVWNTINTVYPLPFTISNGYVGSEVVNQTINPGTTMYDAIKQITDEKTWYRSRSGVIEYASKTSLGGIWRYNANNVAAANMVAWSWRVSVQDFWNAMIGRDITANSYTVTEDGTSVIENGFLVENMESKTAGASTKINGKQLPIPNIEIDAYKEKWRAIECGDTKGLSLVTELDYLDLYLPDVPVSSIKVSANGGMYNVAISVSPETVVSKTGIGQVLKKMSNTLARLETL